MLNTAEQTYKLAPIAVVMLCEAQACSVSATFERKAGSKVLRAQAFLLQKNILL